MFVLFVSMTLGITYWAASRTKSAPTSTRRRRHHRLPERPGDRRRLHVAATLLGSPRWSSKGVDGYIYMIAFFAGWPIILFLMAERLRNLGKFTFADITSYRLNQARCARWRRCLRR